MWPFASRHQVVADAARLAGREVLWEPSRSELAARVAKLARRGDVVITLGAGDDTAVGREILARLREREGAPV
jgi:UDP-N-acetylmuramate--alanine ligase